MVKRNKKTLGNDQFQEYVEYSEHNEILDVSDEILGNVVGGVWMPNFIFHRGSKTVTKTGPDGSDLITRYSKEAYKVIKKANGGKAPGHGTTVNDIE